MTRFYLIQTGMLAALFVISIALLTQSRALSRLRRGMQRDLALIFEQVDVLRLDTQQESVSKTVPVALPVKIPVDRSLGYAAAQQLAAHGADEAEITQRCGLSAAEARILVAMRSMQPEARHPL
jgi:hypothetical protein